MTDGQRPGRPRGLSSVDGDPSVAADDTLAPVIPLFGGGRSRSVVERDAGESAPSGIVDAGGRFGRPAIGAEDVWSGHPSTFGTRDRNRDDGSKGHDVGPDDAAHEAAAAQDETRELAEALLLRKLRSRSLSISEARSAVRGVEGADETLITELIDRFVDLGYLNDTVFAEQLVLSAVERRGEGRRAVASTLLKRGIPRDIADAAIAEMPDDDAERALEYARSKARGVGGKDDDAALRRLAGQLARRGYSSSVALTAARQALREVGVGRSRPARPMSGVRFTPDE
jgi:regulatory protein